MANDQGRDFRDYDEKEEEKRHEKEEKSVDEKWRDDPLSTAGWAFFLIWIGLVLLAQNLDLLDSIDPLETWDLIFIGAGVIVLVQVLIRLLVPAYRRSVMGSLIFAIILLAIGLGDLATWQLIWPTVIIVIGLMLLLRGFIGER